LKLTLALCAAAGALAFAMPAFADTVYDPSTGQSFVTTPSSNFTGATQGTVYVTPGTAADTSATAGPTPGYANSQGSWGGPLEIITAPVRMVTGPFAIMNCFDDNAMGAIAALLVTATPLNASSLMGCVLLVGLVVKNGVLLLEEAERARDRGEKAARAVILGAERRLRPVVMTTLATLAGLLPLALGIGAGAELQRPLAIAVIGGLLTSTLATLGILPPLAALALRRPLPAD